MNTNDTDTEGGFFDVIGGILIIFLIILLVLGVIFASSKWKTVCVTPNDAGGFDTITSTWWGIVKDERSYRFDASTEQWEISIEPNTKIRL